MPNNNHAKQPLPWANVTDLSLVETNPFDLKQTNKQTNKHKHKNEHEWMINSVHKTFELDLMWYINTFWKYIFNSNKTND